MPLCARVLAKRPSWPRLWRIMGTLVVFINIASEAPSDPTDTHAHLSLRGTNHVSYHPRVRVAHHCSAQSTVHCTRTCFNSSSPCASVRLCAQSTILIPHRVRLCARRYGMKTSGLRNPLFSFHITHARCVYDMHPLKIHLRNNIL